MFFGIFSSIIPYLIAAGFYLVYILISFVQPILQKTSSEQEIPEENSVIVEIDASTDNNNFFKFEDYSTSGASGEESGANTPPDFPSIWISYLAIPPHLIYSEHPNHPLLSRPPPCR